MKLSICTLIIIGFIAGCAHKKMQVSDCFRFCMGEQKSVMNEFSYKNQRCECINGVVHGH